MKVGSHDTFSHFQSDVESGWSKLTTAVRALLLDLNVAADKKQAVELHLLEQSCRLTVAAKITGSVEVAIGYFRTESQEALSTCIGPQRFAPSRSRAGGLSLVPNLGPSALQSLLEEIRAVCADQIRACVSDVSARTRRSQDHPDTVALKAGLEEFLGTRLKQSEAVVKSEGISWSYQVVEGLCKVRRMCCLFVACLDVDDMSRANLACPVFPPCPLLLSGFAEDIAGQCSRIDPRWKGLV